ncbi:MAG: hypothetical protein CUN53_00215 [Phototrophicales bacterium]|nr:MAG: hypothetical protein CUN53_00215 [Phototrophicales bacterium]
MRRTALLLFVALLIIAGGVQAQDRSLVWDEWNVRIDSVDVRQNQFNVTESYRITFNGTFRFGNFTLPSDRLELVDQMRVTVNGVRLEQDCIRALPGSFCLSLTSGEYNMTYYFPNTITNESLSIEIAYRVTGALRVYEGGDQLWWDAIPEEHFGFPIRSAAITVVLPQNLAPREGIDPVETYGGRGEIEVKGNIITATATNGLSGNEGFSIRVQYPHMPEARKPRWQAAFDERRSFEENVLPLVNVGTCLLSMLIGLGVPLAVYARWRTHGRDPEVGPVPQYLAELPSNLPPGVVGALVDETADMRDILATLIDLARRGYLVIEEEKTESILGTIQNSEFVFKRTDKEMDGLREYERILLRGVFSGKSLEKKLSDLRNKFYTVVPRIQAALYKELVKENLFAINPETTRSRWSTLGVFLLIVGIAGFFVAGPLSDFSVLIFAIPIAIIIAALSVFIAGMAMSSKTPHGALEAARWNAVKEYLKNLEKYSDLETASAKFDEFLPYAIAFGLDRVWMGRFSQLESVPMPPWYIPIYRGGYYRRYTPGTPFNPAENAGGLPGDLARAGGSGLDSMSGGLSRGLESLSSGLSTMLNSASSVFTSVPQSSSSGRWGGGFSGGGFSGGGGSGGGSRGFG